ncbi:hypothetical protein F4780DRAFT_719431 [Xylariomycetidae sp. FL0641]|nr:hypothetical protein F4780DRAFT_719431 [Xylariomycetidae sp. FL0641]
MSLAMASKTSSIPRFLLPQRGSLWRANLRATAFARPPYVDAGPVQVRYASKVAASSKTPATKPVTAKSAAMKVAAPKAASTKTKSSSASKSSAAKAAKHSAPTKPPSKPQPPKAVPPELATAPETAGAKVTTPEAETPKTSSASSFTSTNHAAASAPESPAPAAKPGTTNSKFVVLEKPERFNPPSHGSRLPRSTPKHYGGPMSAEEVQAQSQKSYPGLPPPPNTWSHWFIHSRGIHLTITMGTLLTLAAWSFTANFKAESPYADMIPPLAEFPRHPLQYLSTCVSVLRMHEEHVSAVTAEKRRRKVDDVAKRNEYRKAHGMEPATGFWGGQAVLPAPEPVTDPTADPAPVAEAPVQPASTPADGFTPDGKRKKFLGIF